MLGYVRTARRSAPVCAGLYSGPLGRTQLQFSFSRFADLKSRGFKAVTGSRVNKRGAREAVKSRRKAGALDRRWKDTFVFESRYLRM